MSTKGGAGSRAKADFPRAHRIRRRPEFLRAQRDGQRVHTPHYVIVVAPQVVAPQVVAPQVVAPPRRIGITVTKKVADAVGRNRIKRVLREVFRRQPELFPEGCDVVLIAKSGAESLGYHQAADELARVRGHLVRAARRAHRRPAEAR